MSKRKGHCGENETPTKAKKVAHHQKFKSQYSKDFPGILPSTTGENYAYCYPCDTHLKIASGGRNDVSKHCEREKHIENMPRWEERSKVKTQKITDMLKQNETKDRSVIEAEVMWVNFLVEHGIPFIASEHVGKLVCHNIS